MARVVGQLHVEPGPVAITTDIKGGRTVENTSVEYTAASGFGLETYYWNTGVTFGPCSPEVVTVG